MTGTGRPPSAQTRGTATTRSAAPPTRTAEPPALRVASRLPSALGSIRVRLAVTYSCVLFALAAVLVAVIYLGLARALAEAPISRQVVEGFALSGDSVVVVTGERIDPYLLIEREANERALDTMRRWSVGALVGLFVASLGVGWLVAGRVLGPIDRITAVARDIGATDLSRRIDLGGPRDELRQMADTFDEMLARLERSFEEQQRFIQEVSHELRNPLAVIRTNVDVALADPSTPAEELRRTAAVVARASERVSRLVDDLMASARDDEAPQAREPVDLALLVSEAVDDHRVAAEEADVALDAPWAVSVVVPGDRDALRRALANLVANGLRYSPRGSVLELRCGEEGPWAYLAVGDHGPGIGPEDRHRVFERFWQADPDAGRAAGRLGLGLAIVAEVARAHGGAVAVDSAPGRGSTFVMWLPVTDATASGPTRS